MVKRSRTAVILLATLFTVPVNGSEGWHESFDDASAAADRTGVPLLIHFHAPWCGPCRQMKQQVFSKPAIQRQLGQGLIAVEVDVSREQDLAARFGVSSVPRDVVLYPGREPETVVTGFQSEVAYMHLLREIAAKGAANDRVRVRPSPVETTASELPLGLNGFCPVRLIRDRTWVSGNSDVADTYKGVTYHFSSEKDRADFRSDSRRYTPQNLGCDPIVLFTDQKAVTGRIKYGAFFDDRLYLFESVENRMQFKENPLRYTRIRHAVRVDDLVGQQFH